MNEEAYELIMRPKYSAFSIELEAPPSVNKLYRNTRRGRCLTQEAKRWKTYAAAKIALDKRGHPTKFPIRDQVHITRNFIFKDERRRDFQNFIKALDDVLVTGGVLADDNFKIIVSDQNKGSVDSSLPYHLVQIYIDLV